MRARGSGICTEAQPILNRVGDGDADDNAWLSKQRLNCTTRHWPEPTAIHSIACVILDQIKPDGMAFEEFDRDALDSDARLYV